MGISVYQLVTDRIIAELEKGNIPWNKPWTGIRSGAYSRSTGKPYSVLNQMLLMKPGGYCNRYCGRGQLFSLLGGRFGLSRKRDIPRWMKSKAFRYGFLIFFFAMFFLMLWNTYLVFAGAQPATGGNAAVDIQAALALGVSWHAVSPRRGAVRLWVLQRDAHLHRAGADHHGAVQTPELVRLLPHGYDDPADL